jgi:NAD(P)-dependent dehydrogenase (short-subunit alcohol dehydrogenase family)
MIMGTLDGKIALVTGATRGAGRGIALELAAAGAFVYSTGRSTRAQRSEMDRPETIDETVEMIEREGGRGAAAQVDHSDPAQVEALIARIESEQGRLDVLVNDIWGGDKSIQWNVPVWEHSLEQGLKMMHRAIDTHIITSHFALPLLIKNPGGLVIEVTDGTAETNSNNYRVSLFYDLSKTSIVRMAWLLGHELAPHQCTAVAVSPGWLRSEQMLDNYQVAEDNWVDATVKQPHFAISETPRYVGRAVAHLAADPDVARLNGKSFSSGELAKVYGFTDTDGSQPDAWRYMMEVVIPGKPADTTGYR